MGRGFVPSKVGHMILESLDPLRRRLLDTDYVDVLGLVSKPLCCGLMALNLGSLFIPTSIYSWHVKANSSSVARPRVLL